MSKLCGYCGEEFSNFPCNWDARYEHLIEVHKFGECNQTEKFFPADHSISSTVNTSGKWINMLENACTQNKPRADALGGTVIESGEPNQSAAQNLTVVQ